MEKTGTMKRIKIGIGLLLAVAIALIAAVFFHSGKNTAAPVVNTPAASQAVKVKRTPEGGRRSGQAGKEKKFKEPAGAQKEAVEKAKAEPASAVSAATVEKENPAQAAAEEKRVEAWESLIDSVSEQTSPPTQEQAEQIKKALHKLNKEDQMDGIQGALNLLPDEQFALLYPILFDKTEDPEILDAIFSDALNRDDEIKIPIMKELYKDKTHPMYVESARILDATGELDEPTGEDETEGE